MNGKGQALSLHKLVEPGPAPVTTGAQPTIPAPQGPARASWHSLPVPPATGAPQAPPCATHAPQNCLQFPAPAAAPEVSPAPARPDACKVQENQSESRCGQPPPRAAGPAPSVLARAREPLFDRFCHNFLLPPPPPPPPPGRCHLPGGAFLAAAPARPRRDPGRLTQGVVAE